MPSLTLLSQRILANIALDQEQWRLKHTIAESTPADNNEFGFSVDIDQNNLVIGAYGFANYLGRVYLYNVTTGQFIRSFVYPGVKANNAQFGYAVAIKGNYCIVGAPGDGANNLEGKAYIFNVSTGSLVYTLNNPVTAANKEFGKTVAISESYAAVGAPIEDAGGSRRGRCYVYGLSDGLLDHTIQNPNAFGTSDLDQFGNAADMTDNYLIVGAYQEEDASGTISGKAYIFNPASGALLQTLNNPNPVGTSANDVFGTSVAISDTYCIVGAPDEDEASATNAGKAYIFENSTGTLFRTLNAVSIAGVTDNDKFGTSVAITDTYALVGAVGETFAGGVSDSGAAHLFDIATGDLIKSFENPNAFGTRTTDIFGTAVALTDTNLVIGAPREDTDTTSNSGRVYVYK